LLREFRDDETYSVILNLIQDLLARGEIPDIRFANSGMTKEKEGRFRDDGGL
jgi:hypothetical protein